MLQDDLILNPIDYSNGIAKLPEGEGWGVELDEHALNKYATNSTVILEN
jgi:L-alanine-DL-glutamate epimerase-like enolase superfamily enzyme